MIVGVPRERKTAEYRIAISPTGVAELTDRGHAVLIEKGAGEGSSISDAHLESQGATIVPDTQEVFGAADLLLKVKEPQPEELEFLREGQILFAYLHLAAYPEIAGNLLNKGIVAIAYETVQLQDGSLPLLAPMSEIAGRLATQIGAHYLEKAQGGRGVLVGGVAGISPGTVVVLGGGTAGVNAASIALGMRADVVVLDSNLSRLRWIDAVFQGRMRTLHSNRLNLERCILDADLLVGTVLIPGASAPKLVTTDMVQSMQKGSVLVDVAIDQGGCAETSHETSHLEPVYVVHDVIHYAVGNIPGAVPISSTYALTNATIHYVLRLAELGVSQALARYPELEAGVNLIGENVCHPALAESLGRPSTPARGLIGELSV